jgi:hypothetical protein
VIDDEQAQWLAQGAPSITLASCDASGAPSLGQGICCRVASEPTRVRVFLVEARNRALIADLRAGRPIAVVFTHSPTLRSLQLKARRADEVSVEPSDHVLMSTYVDSVVQAWSYAPEPMVRALLATGPGPIIAFELQPSSAFDQTPGPQAGASLSKPRS